MRYSRYLMGALTGVLGVLPVIAIAIVLNSKGTAESVLEIRARDDCDPTTFNLMIGAGTCVGNGNTTFTRFLQEFMEDGSVGAWKFSPDTTGIDAGQKTLLVSRGGELHTFTKVKTFGGGIVPILNTEPETPECLALGGNPTSMTGDSTPIFPGAVIPGPVAGSTTLPRGKTRFQCCIHPWMRVTLEVKSN
jgi:hypothetical protein